MDFIYIIKTLFTFILLECIISFYIGRIKKYKIRRKYINKVKYVKDKKLKNNNMNKSGIIYLIQPEEFINTSVYKIGCSSKPTLDRVRNGYGKGSRYLYICNCCSPFEIERKLIKIFNEKFDLVQGREYFSGNEYDIKKCFISEFEKINNSYREEIISENFAYLIEINLDTSEYLKLDRNHKYIGHSNMKKSNPYGWRNVKRCYLYNDANKPWTSSLNKEIYNKKLEYYKEFYKLKT